MTIKISILIAAIILICPAAFAQTVSISGKKIVYKRPKPFADHKNSFWINHPRVKASTPALSRKIESAISFERAIPLNIREEINDVQWLEEANFTVDHNKNGILTITLTIYGSGAYPSSSDKTVVVDTRTGNRVRPSDIFVNLSGLAAMVRKAQQVEITEAINAIRNDPENNEPDPVTLFTDANFTAKDLNNFSVGGAGVTFIYDYGFPHVIQALQPNGNFVFTWAQLKPFIKRGGLLTRIAR